MFIINDKNRKAIKLYEINEKYEGFVIDNISHLLFIKARTMKKFEIIKMELKANGIYETHNKLNGMTNSLFIIMYQYL